MIDHSGHAHPSTPKARALCRANGGTGSIAKTGAALPKIPAALSKPKTPVVSAKPIVKPVVKQTPVAPKKEESPVAKKATPKPSRDKPAAVTRKKGNTDFSLKRKNGETQTVMLDGEEVGTISKVTQEETRDISGTNLRHAKGKQVTRYFVKLDKTKFEEDHNPLFVDRVGSSSLRGAENDLKDRLSRLTQKPAAAPKNADLPKVPGNDRVAKSFASGEKEGPRRVSPFDVRRGMEAQDKNGVWLPVGNVLPNSDGSHRVVDTGGYDLQVVPAGGKLLVRNKPPERLSGGAIGDTFRMEMNDGSVLVRKSIKGLPQETIDEIIKDDPSFADNFHSAKDQQDAEELSSMLARMMGLKAPEIHRTANNEVVQEFMEGQVATSLPGASVTSGERRFSRWSNSDQGVMVGLLDQVIGNGDRNDGNWMVDGNDLVVIDHGFGWDGKIRSKGATAVHGIDEFAQKFVTGERSNPKFKDNDVAPADLDRLTEIFKALEPEFSKRGQAKWVTWSLGQIEALRPYAKGTKRRIS